MTLYEQMEEAGVIRSGLRETEWVLSLVRLTFLTLGGLDMVKGCGGRMKEVQLRLKGTAKVCISKSTITDKHGRLCRHLPPAKLCNNRVG